MHTLRLCFQLLLAAVLPLCPMPAAAQDADSMNMNVLTPRFDGPAGATYFPRTSPPVTPDPSWLARTGHKKGVRDNGLDAEQDAAPDFAILKRGFFEAWPLLLAELREAAVMAEPGAIAGLERTKPVLIIPSGGLAGSASSVFFRAGLEEYVRSGGTLLCFSQAAGTDFAGLPKPAGSNLVAAGWDDDGMVFRASSIQGTSPALSGSFTSVPDIETSGYLAAYPAGAEVLLSRPDGKATMVRYPLGAGSVLVTTLFPDFTAAYERLDPEEASLLRSLLQWAKHPSAMVTARPAERLVLPLQVAGPDAGAAASLRIAVIGPSGETIGQEQQMQTTIASGATATVQVTTTVPQNPAPGVYHLEYRLFDASGKPLILASESTTGWFSISRRGNAALPQQLLPEPPSGLRLDARWELTAAGARLLVDCERTGAHQNNAEHPYFVRAGNQEKQLAPGPGRTALAFNLTEQQARGPVLVAAYRRDGRLAGRLTVDPLPSEPGISLDRALYQPGDRVMVKTRGLGKGQLSLIAPGSIQDQMAAPEKPLSLTLPASLPAGVYNVNWVFEVPGKKPKSGSLPVRISGYRVQARAGSITRDEKSGVVRCNLVIRSTESVTTTISAKLRGPEAEEAVIADRNVVLRKGEQTIPFEAPFKPAAAGIAELQYDITTRLPARPGVPTGPVTLASGRTLLDAGNASLLGLAASKPVFYEPEGPMELFAFAFGKGTSRIELFLDNDRVFREKPKLDGLAVIPVRIDGPRPGMHGVKAVLEQDDRTSTIRQTYLYGAEFPDLAVDLAPGEASSLTTSLGVTVRNQGKSASGKTVALVYEGTPAAEAKQIARVEVPQLAPGEAYRTTIGWNAAGKIGTVKFTAVADPAHALVETDRRNNSASADLTIPSLALRVEPLLRSAPAGKSVAYAVTAVNFSSERLRGLSLRIDVMGPTGNIISSETVPLTEFGETSELKFDRTTGDKVLGIGSYRIQARLYRTLKMPLAAGLAEFSVDPTLHVTGSLDRTPDTAYQCMPFTLEYGTTTSGNVPATSGGLLLDIRQTGTSAPVYSLPLPLTEQQPVRIERITFPQGDYVISLRSSVTNSRYHLKQDAIVAEQALRVRPPVILQQHGAPLPRVLVWQGKNSGALDRAVAETLVKQAFEDEEVYYRAVGSGDEFATQVKSGLFNLFVVMDPDDPLEDASGLASAVKNGAGMVIIGAEARSRSLAETFGFRFSEPLTADKGSMLVFSGSDTGLSGSVPLSGSYLLPQKQDAQPVILLNGSREPVALLGRSGAGKVLVMPFSLTRSARDAGSIPLFSLLLRSTALGIAPTAAESGPVTGEELTIAAPNGPVRSIVTISLPQGSEAIWTNRSASLGINTIRFELTAEKEPQKIQFLYRRAAGVTARAAAELSYECGGNMTPPRRIE